MAVSHTGQYRLGAMSSLLHSTPTMMSDTYLAVSHIVNHLQEIIMSPLPTSGNCIPVPGVSSKGRSKGRSQLQGKVQGPLGEDKVQRCGGECERLRRNCCGYGCYPLELCPPSTNHRSLGMILYGSCYTQLLGKLQNRYKQVILSCL